MTDKINRFVVLLVLIGITQSCANAQFDKMLNKAKKAIGTTGLSTEEVAAGLKEALVKGTTTGTDLVLSQEIENFRL